MTTETLRTNEPQRVREYRGSSFMQPIDLDLSRNEGACVLDDPGGALSACSPETLRRYRRPEALRDGLARMIGIEQSRVVVTNGGDDAIDRIFRLALAGREPGRRAVVTHRPTFEMIDISRRNAGGEPREVPWRRGPFPIDEFLAAIDETTALVVIVSPNNPTGAVVGADEMVRIARRAAGAGALTLIDLAYVEFANEDPTERLVNEPNVVVVRTLSKAWGLAGLRLGYALAGADTAASLRALVGPFPVSAVSEELALASLERADAMRRNIEGVRESRRSLVSLLDDLGVTIEPSEANFVLAETGRAAWLADALAGLGIGVRRFDAPAELADTLRITCPASPAERERLRRAIDSALRPEALLFDMDGVIADVSSSYRRAIMETAAEYGVAVDAADVAAAKREPDSNNDWEVTHRLIRRAGRDVPYESVRDSFERRYHGDGVAPGLKQTESLLIARGVFEQLAGRWRLAVVTGRPRADAMEFLERFGLAGFFGAVVAMEDGPAKPDPAPVNAALQRLEVHRAWMIGDAPDDATAARAAGVVPIGIGAPSEPADTARDTLLRAGAARVLGSIDELMEMLP